MQCAAGRQASARVQPQRAEVVTGPPSTEGVGSTGAWRRATYRPSQDFCKGLSSIHRDSSSKWVRVALCNSLRAARTGGVWTFGWGPGCAARVDVGKRGADSRSSQPFFALFLVGQRSGQAIFDRFGAGHRGSQVVLENGWGAGCAATPIPTCFSRRAAVTEAHGAHGGRAAKTARSEKKSRSSTGSCAGTRCAIW